MEIKSFKNQNRETSYISLGDSQPTKILFVHGTPGRAEDLCEENAQSLAEHFHIVSYDRPGHGRSTSAEISFEENRQAILDLTKHLGWQDWILLGHSTGAAFSLDFALAHPDQVNALLLLNPIAFPTEGSESSISSKKLKLPGMFSMMKSKIEAQLEQQYRKYFSPEALPAGFFESRKPQKDQARAMLEEQEVLAANLDQLTGKYSKLQHETMILACKDDEYSPVHLQAERLYQSLAGAHFVSEPSGSHALPMKESKALLQAAKLLKMADLKKAANA